MLKCFLDGAPHPEMVSLKRALENVADCVIADLWNAIQSGALADHDAEQFRCSERLKSLKRQSTPE